MSTRHKRTYANFDLEVGESASFPLRDGRRKTVRLIGLHEQRDSVRGVIRKPVVTLDVDGERREIVSAHYRMPVVVNGVRLDCPVTRGISDSVNAGEPGIFYALDKAARIRCWDPEARLFGEKPMVYPVKQSWFAGMTQMGNERVYVDAGELNGNPPGIMIYHHYGLDFGGFDAAVPIMSVAPARIITLGMNVAAGENWPLDPPHVDGIQAQGEDGRFFRYAHLDMFAPDLHPGDDIVPGQFLGFLGQEGGSGGWAHLHLGIFEMMPSGRFGQVEAYCFAVEAYLNEHPGELLACARPHQVAAPGEPVELDGTNSICDGGKIVSYEWNGQDGRITCGTVVTRIYQREGMYSEMLVVTDDRGRSEVDFCVVQILPKDLDPARTPPTMSVNYYPACGLHAGQPIAFAARTFFKRYKENEGGVEEWDFGDGARAVSCSRDNYPEHRHDGYRQRWHAYERPGRYIITVRRTGRNGLMATAQLKVDIHAVK